MNQPEAVEFLTRVHYGFFMANKRFWYEKDLREADSFIVASASNLRHEITQDLVKEALAVEPL